MPLRGGTGEIPIDFGTIVTEGAVRCDLKENMIVVTPLPDMEPFPVAIRVERLVRPDGPAVKSVVAVDSAGRNIRQVDFKTKDSVVQFRTSENEFAYHLLLGRPSL